MALISEISIEPTKLTDPEIWEGWIYSLQNEPIGLYRQSLTDQSRELAEKLKVFQKSANEYLERLRRILEGIQEQESPLSKHVLHLRRAARLRWAFRLIEEFSRLGPTIAARLHCQAKRAELVILANPPTAPPQFY